MAIRKPRAAKSPETSASIDATGAEVLKRPVGRPPDPFSGKVWLRVTPDELRDWAAEAHRLRIPLGTWVRQTCNGAIRP